MSKYLPLRVANAFIQLSPTGETHMKLQKLVYMAYGVWLREHEEPFIAEQPQVWPYGPVFDSLYHQLKDFRSQPIKTPLALLGEDGAIAEADINAVITRVWEKWKGVSGSSLSEITHLPGSPWHQIAKANNFCVPMGQEIPVSTIKKYFRETSDMAA